MGKSRGSGLVFAAACAGMLLFGMVFISLGTISTFIQEKFGLDAIRTGSLASSLPFGMLLGSVIFGPVADRYGYKLLLISGTLLISLSLEAIALAGSFFILQASFFMIGLGGGIINGGTNALAADITEQAKGAKLSLLGIFFGIGALGMPLLVGLLNRIWDYTVIISATGGFILIPLLFFALISFPEPKQKKGFPVKQGIQLLKKPLILIMGIILFFESGLEGMVSNWTTSFIKNAEFSSENALFALSVQVFALILGRLILSRVLKTFSPFATYLICTVLIITGSLLLLFENSYLMILLSLGLMGFGFAAGFPVILGLTGEKFPHLSGTAFSIVIVMALIGNTGLNYLTGIVSESAGMNHFPWLLAGCSICMGLFLFLLRKEFYPTGNQRKSDQLSGEKTQ